MRIEIEVAPGEYFDKLTILEIKLKTITDNDKLAHIKAEWTNLSIRRSKLQSLLHDEQKTEKLKVLVIKLKHTNALIWDIEDKIRQCEQDQDFGNEFIQTARSIYLNNDKRAALKKEINTLLDSDIMEEKSYTEYQKHKT